MKKLLNNRLFRISMFIFLGGIGGFAYYYFIGCQTGTCPITRNPYISTSYGVLVGLVLSFDSKKKKNREND
jgi:hypothetical protein